MDHSRWPVDNSRSSGTSTETEARTATRWAPSSGRKVSSLPSSPTPASLSPCVVDSGREVLVDARRGTALLEADEAHPRAQSLHRSGAQAVDVLVVEELEAHRELTRSRHGGVRRLLLLGRAVAVDVLHHRESCAPADLAGVQDHVAARLVEEEQLLRQRRAGDRPGEPGRDAVVLAGGGGVDP